MEQGWILSVASQTTQSHVTESDDACMTALLGFREAVENYASDKGSFSFEKGCFSLRSGV